MSEQIIITIDPDPDGVRCGECEGVHPMKYYGCEWLEFRDKELLRGPLCLAAARTLREEREAGYVLAMRLLQQNSIALDEEEIAARDLFIRLQKESAFT